MTNKYRAAIDAAKLDKPFGTAIHLSWDEAGDAVAKLLTGILGRDVKAFIHRSCERIGWEYWCIGFPDDDISGLTQCELEILNDVLEADQEDLGYQRQDEDDPVLGLHFGMTRNAISLMAPFTISRFVAVESGIWILGDYV